MKKLLWGSFWINILWFAAAFLVDRPLLPSPLRVYGHLFQREVLWLLLFHLWSSFRRVLAGMALAAALGLGAGLAMEFCPKLGRQLNPLFYFAYPIPKVAMLPLVMLLFGMGEFSKIILIFLILFFPVAMQVRDALKGVSQAFYDIYSSLGASFASKVWHVALPAALAQTLSTARISIGTALSVLFFAEIYGNRTGLGYFIMDAWGRIHYLDMYSGIVAISFFGFGLFSLLDVLEARFLKWR